MASQQNPLDHDRPPGGGELSAHVPDADDGTDGRPGGGANSGPAAGQQRPPATDGWLCDRRDDARGRRCASLPIAMHPMH